MTGSDNWTGQRVLVTGGAGFIGANLALRLDALGAEVLVVDAMLPGTGAHLRNLEGASERMRVTTGDLRDADALPQWVRGCERVFNLAGRTSHAESMTDPLADLDANASAQLRLLEACRTHAPDTMVVHTSTRQVYGVPQRLPVDESHPIAPMDVNGYNKFAGEGYHLLYHRVHGLRACVLRLTNTYGPRMRIADATQGFVGDWIRRVLRGDPIEVWGGEQLRDLAYVDDVVDALLAAADPRHAGQVYNVGGSPPVALGALARTMVAVNGAGTIHVTPFPAARRAIDIGDYCSDDRRFREASGWRPRVALEDGIARTLRYFRDVSEHHA